jgi:hypothetical protein
MLLCCLASSSSATVLHNTITSLIYTSQGISRNPVVASLDRPVEEAVHNIPGDDEEAFPPIYSKGVFLVRIGRNYNQQRCCVVFQHGRALTTAGKHSVSGCLPISTPPGQTVDLHGPATAII